MTSEVTQAALEPCPWCGTVEHLSFRWPGSMTTDMPDCRCRVVCTHIDHGAVVGPTAYGKFAATTAWNTRLTAQSGEGRSGAGEDAGSFAVAEPRRMGMEDGDPYWSIEIQATGGYYSVAEIYGDTADAVRAKANLAIAAWSKVGDSGPICALADIVVQLSAIGNVLREAHFALDDSEDLSHQDPPVHAVPLDNVMRLHRSLKACERFAPTDEAWDGPGPLAAQIIEQLGHHLTRSTTLQTALEDICNPIAALRRYADERGRQLDGAVAFQLANDPNHLKGIALAALNARQSGEGERLRAALERNSGPLAEAARSIATRYGVAGAGQASVYAHTKEALLTALRATDDARGA